MFGKRPSGVAYDGGTCWDVTGDDRPHSHGCAVADCHVVANTGCWPDPHSRADPSRSADYRQRNDDGVGPHVHVVANVHEVVDLDTVFDSRDAERTAIDAGVRPDFDLVTDLDGPEMWEALEVTVGGTFEPEAVGTQDGARVDPHVAPDPHARVKVNAGFKPAPVAYFAGVSYGAQGSNRYVVGKAGAGGNRGGGVDVGCRACLEESSGDTSECQPGIVDSQHGGDTGSCEVRAAKRRGSIDEEQCRNRSGVKVDPAGSGSCEKGDGAGAGLGDGRHSIEDELLGRDATGKMQGCSRAERGGNVGDGDRLHTLVRCHPDQAG